jgi:hypothetical protein
MRLCRLDHVGQADGRGTALDHVGQTMAAVPPWTT